MYTHWWVHFRSDVYAMDMRFNNPISEDEWRTWLRKHWGYRKLPAGTSIWPDTLS